MRSPEEFVQNLDDPSSELAVDNLCLWGRDVGPARIPVTFGQDFTPTLHLGAFATIADAAGAFSPNTPPVSISWGSAPQIELRVTRVKITDADIPQIHARAKRLPILMETSPNACRFSAVLLSPPRFLEQPVLLHGQDGIAFEITPTVANKDVPCLITGMLALTAKDPLSPLRALMSFMTFLKGSRCGIGNLFAFDTNNAVAFQLLGFTRNDPEPRQTNWFDLHLQKALPDIYTAFSAARADAQTAIALDQAIEYYRAANVLREPSLEMAIIAAHSALEALVNFILEHRAGWSRLLMVARGVAFHDKMRAAAHYLGLRCNMLEHSPQLRKRMESHPDMDAFWAISFFRNKLVHQDLKLRPTGLELHEIWLLAQWLVEVLIFGVIGYPGQMIDRRIYTGWSGTMMQIPLGR